MPEGDTIYRAARTLNRALAGQVVTQFETQLPNLSRVDYDTPISGQTVDSVTASGKWIHLRFSGGLTLWVEYATQSGIAQVYQAQQAAAYPGIEYCISVTHCLEDDLMVEPFQMQSGYYGVPTAPGLGITLDMAAVEKYRVK